MKKNLDYLETEPTFEEYVSARRVVLYEYNRIRFSRFNGDLSVARDEMLATIVHKSCLRFKKSGQFNDGSSFRYSMARTLLTLVIATVICISAVALEVLVK